MPSLKFYRRDDPHQADNCFYNTLASVLIQGPKRSVWGKKEYIYGAGQCIVNGVAMPSASYTTDTCAEYPLLVVSIDIDSQLVNSLAAELPEPINREPLEAVAITQTKPELLEADLRLAKLVDKPEQIPVLAPMIIREIHYRLLSGPLGNQVRLVMQGNQTNQVTRAISWLRQNYKEPLQVNELAKRVIWRHPLFIGIFVILQL